MILYQDCSSHLDSSKNMAARGRGLFSLYIFIENFKNLLVRNHSTDFNIILQKCSFGDPLPRLFKPFGFVKKHGHQGAGLIFPIYLYRKLEKKSSCCRPRWLSWIRRPTGDQEVAGSTPAEIGNILSWRLIMKYFLRSFSPFRWFKKGSCQFLAKECAQYWLTA